MQNVQKLRKDKGRTAPRYSGPKITRRLPGHRGTTFTSDLVGPPIPTKTTVTSRNLIKGNIILPSGMPPADKNPSRNLITALNDLTAGEVSQSTIAGIIMVPYSSEMIDKIALFEVEVPTGTKATKSYYLDDPRLGAQLGSACTTCGEDAYTCPGHHAKISFGDGIYLWNPLTIETAAMVLQCVCRTCANLMIDPKILINTYNVDKLPANLNRLAIIKDLSVANRFHRNQIGGVKCSQNPIYKAVNVSEKPEIVIQYQDGEIKKESTFSIVEARRILNAIPPEHLELMGFKYGAHPVNFIVNKILVEPICTRQIVIDGSTIKSDSKQYAEIAKIAKNIKLLLAKEPTTDTVNAITNLVSELRTAYTALVIGSDTSMQSFGRPEIKKGIVERIKGTTGKKSYFRVAGAGGRTNFSGRTVAGSDPYIRLDEIAIPWRIAKEVAMTEDVIDINLAKYQKQVDYGSIKFVQSGERIFNIKEVHAKGGHFTLKVGQKIIRPLRDGDWVVANRQPTLNKGGIMAFKARVFKNRKNVGLRSEVVSSYNLDHDGDELTLHFLTTAEARAEAMVLMNAANNLLGESSNSPINGSIMDNVVGGFLLSQTDNIESEVFESLIPLDLDEAELLGWRLESVSKVIQYHPETEIGKRIESKTGKIYSTDLEGAIETEIDVSSDSSTANVQPVLFDPKSIYLQAFNQKLTNNKAQNEETKNLRSAYIKGLKSVVVYTTTRYWYEPKSKVDQLIQDKMGAWETEVEPRWGMERVVARIDIDKDFKDFAIVKGIKNGVEINIVLDSADEIYNVDELKSVVVPLPGAKYRMGINPYSILGRKLDKYGVPPFSGRALISTILPDGFNYKTSKLYIRDGIMISGFLDKSSIGIANRSIPHMLALNFGVEVATTFIEKIAVLTNNWLKYNAISPSLFDVKLDAETRKLVDVEINQAIDDAMAAGAFIEGETVEDKRIKEEKIKDILNIVDRIGKMIVDALPDDNPIKQMAISGSKGGSYNIGQIYGLIGQQFINRERPKLGLEDGLRCFVEYQTGDTNPMARGFCSDSYFTGFKDPAGFKAHTISSRVALEATAKGSASIGYSRRKEFTVVEEAKIYADYAVRSTNNREVMSVYGGDGMDPASLFQVPVRSDKFKVWKRNPDQVLHFIDIGQTITDLNVKHGVDVKDLVKENRKRLENFFAQTDYISIGKVTKGSKSYFGKTFVNKIPTLEPEELPETITGEVEEETEEKEKRETQQDRIAKNIKTYLDEVAEFLNSDKEKDIIATAILIINQSLPEPVIRSVDTSREYILENLEPDITRIARQLKNLKIDPRELDGTGMYLDGMIPLTETSTIL